MMMLPQDQSIVVNRNNDGAVVEIVMLMASDFHAHFRLADMLKAVAAQIAGPYKYVLAMPNTKPHKVTASEALAYKLEIEAHLRTLGIVGKIIIPTVYLCKETTVATLDAMMDHDVPIAIKSYPPGGTTNSDEASPLLEMDEVLRAMPERGIRLLVHGETVIDKYGKIIPHEHREDYFMTEVYPRVRDRHPDIHICLEHVTTHKAIELVKADQSGKTVCTITPQHMLLSNAAFGEVWGGVNVRCMPYLKDEDDRFAVADFGTSGDKRAIAGSDIAPHPWSAKDKPLTEAACGCYTPHALAMYAKVAEDMGRLDERFVSFVSQNGPRWWGLPMPTHEETVNLINDPLHSIPEPTPLPYMNDRVVPLGWTPDFEDRMKLEFALPHGC